MLDFCKECQAKWDEMMSNTKFEPYELYPIKTLRDEFAMAALSGILAYPGTRLDEKYENISIWAFEQADAMLKAREQGE